MRTQRHRTINRRRKRSVPPTRSIDNRPEEIEQQQEAGHWEINLVVGGKGQGSAVLLSHVNPVKQASGEAWDNHEKRNTI